MPVTGLELPAAIGLTADVLAVVKACVEGTARIVAFIRMEKKLPQEFSELDFTLCFVSDTLETVAQVMESDESSAINVPASINFLQFCSQYATRIQKQLDSVLPHLAESRRSRAWKAVKSMVKHGELKTEMDQLRQYVQLLITQQTHALVRTMHISGRANVRPQPITTPTRPPSQISITSQGRPVTLVIPNPEEMAMAVQRRTGRKVHSKVLDWADEVSSVADGNASSRPTLGPRQSSSRIPTLSTVNEDEEDSALSSDSESVDSWAEEDSEVTLCATPNDLDAIRQSNFLLRQGCSYILTNAHEARKILKAASHRTHGIKDNLGPVGVRKFRLLTHIAIGLAKTTTPPDAHLDKARLYNRSAMTVATQAGNDSEGHCDKVRLDEANVHLARSKSAKRGSEKRKQFERAAFEVFDRVVASCEDSCATVDHHVTHASALLGCGRLVEKVGGTGGAAAGPLQTYAPANVYLDRALNTVRKAKTRPFPSPVVCKSLLDVEREILAAIGK